MPDLSCSANAQYDPEKPRAFGDSLQVDSSISRLDDDESLAYSSWSVQLAVHLESAKGTNVPYDISVQLVGLFQCSSAPADMPPKSFVEINGSSILYGQAREVIRNVTCIGPWGALMLPTLSFTKDIKPSKAEEKEPKTTAVPPVRRIQRKRAK